jgi:hypothetical protein
MTQALYVHMNNKTIRKIKKKELGLPILIQQNTWQRVLHKHTHWRTQESLLSTSLKNCPSIKV